jgi:hypothetical protein
MMKIMGLVGVLLGIAGSIYIIVIGLDYIYTFGSQTSDAYNGRLMTTYGAIFLGIFLFTSWLMSKRYWKSCLVIGILCTLFSVLGLFSIGPFLFVGSFIILVHSIANVVRSR